MGHRESWEHTGVKQDTEIYTYSVFIEKICNPTHAYSHMDGSQGAVKEQV